MATRVILGSGNLGLEDLFAVAAWGYEVTLDLTLEEQVRKRIHRTWLLLFPTTRCLLAS